MQNLQSLKRSITSAKNLQSIVTTMKAHASANITQFEQAAKASMSYKEVLDKALYVVLSQENGKINLQKDEDGSTIHVVFGADYGLAGRFNERMAAYALSRIPKGNKDFVIVVGQQVLNRIEQDFEIAGSFSVPQTEEGVVPVIQRLLAKIDQLRDEGTVQQILLHYSIPLDNIGFEETSEVLFPIDLNEISNYRVAWKSNSLPTFSMDRDTLISDLLRQYFFLLLYRTFCYSLVSENRSRIASMDSAEKNIEERLQELNFLYRRDRQANITEEINDVISGFRTIKKK